MTRRIRVLIGATAVGLLASVPIATWAGDDVDAPEATALEVIEDDEMRAADVELGRKIAVRDCGGCHAPGEKGESLIEGTSPLRDFAKRWPVEYLAESLAEGIVSGHPLMPDYQYTPEQINDLLAYLDLIGKSKASADQ